VGHDDGMTLDIGGQNVITVDLITDFTESTETVEFLDPGLYPMSLALFENFGEADLVFSYITPNANRQLVPTAVLNSNVVPEPTGLIIWNVLGILAGGAVWYRRRRH
jgi:hypothetical protein